MARGVLYACVVAALLCVPAGAERSFNWAGYAAVGTSFTEVHGTWVQPAADCLNRATSETIASFWVGLGGYDGSAIEQVGTDSDCDSHGGDYYYAWYQMWPERSADLRLRVSPGDRIAALVRALHGGKVVVQLRNVTTGKSVSRTLRPKAHDYSSAEWIAEAPSSTHKHESVQWPLTNFGRVGFSNAGAVSASGHAGPISDPAWTARVQKLATGYRKDATPAEEFFDQASYMRGLPSGLREGGKSFTVVLKRGASRTTKPTGPGAA